VRAILTGTLLLAVTPLVPAGPPEKSPPPLGTRIADFTLPRAAGGPNWSLVNDARDAKAVVVLFLGTECPVNNAYAPVLAGLHEKYAPKDVVFVAVNSNQQDDAAAVAKHAKEFGIPFPVLKDEGAAVADKFHAERTPEAFVLDGSLTARYRGRIDDQIARGGIKRPRATRHDLVAAIDQVLAGNEVAVPCTEVSGCPISRPSRPKSAAGAAVTYDKEVSRLIQKHCQVCHRPGEAGPFPLMTYADAAAWAEAIKEAITDQRMPPWHADPAHGRFANDRRLTDAERSTFLAWIDQGCPEGNTADLPPARQYVTGWGIGRPDEIVTMNKELEIPARAPRGGLPYRYIMAGKPFAEDRWVWASEVRPGNRSIVHHINVYAMRPGAAKLPDGDELSERLGKRLFEDPSAEKMKNIPELASYTPGDQLFELAPGMARFVPKGTRLVFELHYVPNGKAMTDRSAIGLKYLKEPPAHEVFQGLALNWAFLIPPNTDNYRVKATFKFDRDSVLISLTPHMHLRGKSFEFRLVTPDGKEEVLLKVPRYDFGWQENYVLAEPRKVSKGSKLVCTAHYDNSAANANNPDPKAYVIWGDQSSDEMMMGYFDYYFDDPKADGKPGGR
jgi:thiol-disulfide isomerase/thioredoxin/mono/diheme cytochrome c family protein